MIMNSYLNSYDEINMNSWLRPWRGPLREIVTEMVGPAEESLAALRRRWPAQPEH